MAVTQGMSTLQSVKLTCSEINDETTKMKTQLDKWLDASRKGLENLDEQNTDQMRKYKVLKTEQARVQKEEEKQRQELQLIEMRIGQMREKENVVPQQLEAIRKVLQRNIETIATLRKQIEGLLQARQEKQQELSKGTSYYSTHLGLIFERFPDRPNQLRFTFTLIDPKDHSRPFYFVISVDNEYYQVEECQPAVTAVPELAKQLNKSNNLSAFVRSMRREFCFLVHELDRFNQQA